MQFGDHDWYHHDDDDDDDDDDEGMFLNLPVAHAVIHEREHLNQKV